MILVFSTGGDGDFRGKITGGTGKFAGATGTFRNHPVKDNADITLYLK